MRKRPPRIRWLLTICVSFTAGAVCAATLFAYTSQIPIPLKISPTRGADDLLRKIEREPANSLEFQDRLSTRELNTIDAPEPGKAADPNLPAATAATLSVVAPQQISTVPQALVYYVQAGAFTDIAQANELVTTLSGLGMNAQLREASGTQDRELFRVIIGPFEQVGDAESVRAELALSGRSSTLLRLAENRN